MAYKILVDGGQFANSEADDTVVINPVVTLQANSAGELTFTIPPDHPHYDKIQRRTSVVSVYRDNDENPIFQGVATDESVDFYKQKTITCEGELSYLNDSILRPAKYSGKTVLELLTAYITEHNSQVDEQKQFEIGNVTVTDPNNAISCYTNYNSTMTEIKEDLVDDLGGYLRVRYDGTHKYIDYIDDAPKQATQTIELKKNLLDYASDIDNTEVATIIIPLGAQLDTQEIEGLDQRLTIASVNSGKDYLANTDAIATYGKITKVVTWDDVTDASNLKKKGQKYLENIIYENLTLEVTAIDLGYLTSAYKKFELLDKVTVKSAAHNLNKAFVITKMTLNLADPSKDTFTLGDTSKTTLTAQSATANSEIIKKIEKQVTSSVLESAVATATALITGNSGGNVVIRYNDDGTPYEILIMDTADISTAKKVWRWDLGGFGFSSTGVDGPFTTAITQNGAIVADFITTGALSADRINGGTITASSFNESGTITKYAKDYTEDDSTRIKNIVLGTVEATSADIEKYDFYGYGRITIADAVVVQKFLLGQETKRDISVNLKIGPQSTNNILQTDGVVIGKNGIYSKYMTADDFYSKKYKTYNDSGEVSGVTGTFTTGDGYTVRVTNGIVTGIA